MLSSSFAGGRVSSSSSTSFACGHRLNLRLPQRVLHAPCIGIEAAHKKGAGSTKNGRDSNAQRRGVKVYGGQEVKAGGIIVRQLGTKVSGSGWLCASCKPVCVL